MFLGWRFGGVGFCAGAVNSWCRGPQVSLNLQHWVLTPLQIHAIIVHVWCATLNINSCDEEQPSVENMIRLPMIGYCPSSRSTSPSWVELVPTEMWYTYLMLVGISTLRVTTDEMFSTQGEGESKLFPLWWVLLLLRAVWLLAKQWNFPLLMLLLSHLKGHWSLCCIAVYFTYSCCWKWTN